MDGIDDEEPRGEREEGRLRNMKKSWQLELMVGEEVER